MGLDVVKLPYSHHLIIADIRFSPLRATRLKLYFNFIVTSPPCVDFSDAFAFKRCRVPQRGIGIVLVVLQVIFDAQPIKWLLENVKQLSKYWPLLKCKQTVNLRYGHRTMQRSFFGDYPIFPVIAEYTEKDSMHYFGKLRAWERAYIPISIGTELARALET